jgi:hypothetical protein
MPPVRIRLHDVDRRRPTSMSRSLNSLITVKGCFVFAVFLMVTSCYMHSLARALTSSSNAADGLEVNSCVRKVEQQCKLYPCKERNGAMEEITPPSRFFGYAGNFVRRQGNITKPHQLFCKYFFRCARILCLASISRLIACA